MKYLYFSILGLITQSIHAQEVAAPSELKASYKKFTDRIELSWRAPAADYRYIIHRRSRPAQNYTPIDTVSQNRYIDRNRLNGGTEYFYRVQTLAGNGRTSAAGEEALGALLPIADGRDTLLQDKKLEDCLKFSRLETKVTPSLILFKYRCKAACDNLADTADMYLYYSRDEQLDAEDPELTRLPLSVYGRHAALAAKNGEGIKEGYLIVKVESGGQSLILTARI